MKKFKTPIIKLLVSAGLFGILLWKVNLHQLLEKTQKMELRYIPLILIFIVLNYVISSIRWKRLLIFPNSEKVSTAYLIRLYFIGSFFNNFMPTSIGGDVYKVLKLGKKIDSKTNAFTATFMERFLGVLMLLVISLVGIIKLLGWVSLLLVAVLIVAAIFGFSFIGFLARRSSKAKSVIDSALEYKNNKDAINFALVNSLFVQMFAVFSQYFIFIALGFTPPFFYAMFVLPLITLTSFFVPSLNGIGVQDSLYVSLFSVVGISVEGALTASILYHISRLVVSLFGGLLYALDTDN